MTFPHAAVPLCTAHPSTPQKWDKQERLPAQKWWHVPREEYLHSSPEQVSEQESRVSKGLRTPFLLNLLQPGSACTLLAGKRCGFGVFKTMEGSTLILPVFDWVLKPHWAKRHNTYLFLFSFLFLSLLCPSLSRVFLFFLFSFGQFTTEQQHQKQSFSLKALALQLGQASPIIGGSCACIPVSYLAVPNLVPKSAASIWAWLQGCASQWDFRLGFQWNVHFSGCSSDILKQHFSGFLFTEISGLQPGVLIMTQSLYICIPASGTGDILMNHINV